MKERTEFVGVDLVPASTTSCRDGATGDARNSDQPGYTN